MPSSIWWKLWRAARGGRLSGDGTHNAKHDANDKPNCEPDVMQSFFVRARQRGTAALEALYDHLAQGDGGNLIYFPIFNSNDGHLDALQEMLVHPRALFGLGDAGAHVGTVCDASFTTFMLTHWVRDLPGGGKRFVQKAGGYRATWVAGRCVQQDGEATAARPGRLVRMGV